MCGIFGIAGTEEGIASEIVIGLNDLQHRGEQACGVAISNGKKLRYHCGEGLVAEVFNEARRQKLFGKLAGNLGIGHTLYSTVGRGGERKQTRTFQPLIGDFHGKPFALGHNGNLIDLNQLREEAEAAGYIFNSKVSDTEVVVALLSTSKETDFIKFI